MSHISIESPPDELSVETKEYLTRQFVNTNIALGQTQHLDPITILPYKPQGGDVYFFSEPVLPEIEEAGYYGYRDDAYYRLDNVPEINTLPPISVLPVEPIEGGLYYFDTIIDPEITSVGYWGYSNDLWVKLDNDVIEIVKAYGGIKTHQSAFTDILGGLTYPITVLKTAMISDPVNVIQDIVGSKLKTEVAGVYQVSAKLTLTATTTTTNRKCFITVRNITKSIDYPPIINELVADSFYVSVAMPTFLIDSDAGDEYMLIIGDADSDTIRDIILYDTDLTMVLTS